MAGCGDTDNTENQIDGEGSIDIRSYFPFEDITKNYQIISKKGTNPLINNYFTEDI